MASRFAQRWGYRPLTPEQRSSIWTAPAEQRGEASALANRGERAPESIRALVLLVAQNELNGLAWLIWGGALLMVAIVVGGWSLGALGGRKGLIIGVALVGGYVYVARVLIGSAERLRTAIERNREPADRNIEHV